MSPQSKHYALRLFIYDFWSYRIRTDLRISIPSNYSVWISSYRKLLKNVEIFPCLQYISFWFKKKILIFCWKITGAVETCLTTKILSHLIVYVNSYLYAKSYQFFRAHWGIHKLLTGNDWFHLIFKHYLMTVRYKC